MSKSLGNVVAPQEVANKYGADILRLWVMMSDTTEDLRIGPEILKQQAELYRRLRNTLRWLLGSLAGFTEAERVPVADMPELERWVLHRLTELDARIRARGGKLRLDRRLSGAAQFLRHRSVGVLFRHPQGRALLRPAGQPAPPRRAHGAGPSAPLPDAPGSRRCCASPPRKPGPPASATTTACICSFSRRCRRDWRDDALAAKWETIRDIRRRITVPLEEAAPRQTPSAPRCRPRSTLPLAPDEAELLSAGGMGGDRHRLRRVTRRSPAAPTTSPTVDAGARRRNAPAAGGCCPRSGTQPAHPDAVPALRRRGRVRAWCAGRRRRCRRATGRHHARR